jgi:cytochrome P450
VETTVSSATALTYILASYPEVQTKGQAEIDKVIGPDRLPFVSDREQLPYIHAIVKEVGRWHSVVPLGELCCQSVVDSLVLIHAMVFRCGPR